MGVSGKTSTGVDQGRRTVTLSQVPFGICLEDCVNDLDTERCGTAENVSYAAEVVFGAELGIADDVDKHGRYDAHEFDFESFNGREEGVDVEAGEDNDLIAAVLGYVGD